MAPVASVSVSPATPNLAVDHTARLGAVARDSVGNVLASQASGTVLALAER